MKMIKTVIGAGLFLGVAQANSGETLTLMDAFNQCRASYPSSFEAKKRLACLDSIDLKVLGEANSADVEVPNLVKAAAVAEAASGSTALDSPKSRVDVEDLIDAETQAKLKQANAVDSQTAVVVVEKMAEPSFLDRKWRLTSKGDWNISDFETYKSNYLLITDSSNPNDTPSSPNFATSPDRDLQYQDVKFQFSLKTELMKSIPIVRKLPYVTSSRLWAAYTQQSYWQFFNARDSRPFRENNYEPELILSLGLDNKDEGIIKPYLPRMLNLGFVHQSNGREDPLSRSWNRIYLQGGWELNDKFTLMVRPMWRIPEARSKDDNPDIVKYMGYGDVSLRWDDPSRKMAASVLLRNNLRSDNKGFVQLDFQRQITEDRNINFHILVSSGYGASLLDYNTYQNTIGFGISLGE